MLKPATRIFAASLLIAVSVAVLGYVFWSQEYKYALPTPIPTDYEAVSIGSAIQNLHVSAFSANGVFLHFFNPDCPCSKFNVRHLQSLIRIYGDSLTIAIVVPTLRDKEKAVEEFGEDQHYIIDHDGALAKSCGVYSTPQAAIIDHSGKLYYRGNYNRSRYCTARETNYAELALIALLNRQSAPAFDLFASQSYGCSLAPTETIADLIF